MRLFLRPASAGVGDAGTWGAGGADPETPALGAPKALIRPRSEPAALGAPKALLRIFLILIVLSTGCFVIESLLQPKVRAVPLEGVPITTGSPDVTFMLGASMDPPVLTNPFLVIFSPIERLTDKTRVIPGSLNTPSDSSAIFVWDAFGIRTAWYLDRSSQDLSPLFVRSSDLPAFLCARIFPMIASVRYSHDLEIRKGSRPGVVEVGTGGSWTEMEFNPSHGTLWPSAVARTSLSAPALVHPWPAAVARTSLSAPALVHPWPAAVARTSLSAPALVHPWPAG